MKHKWIIGVIIIIVICAVIVLSSVNVDVTEVDSISNDSSGVALKVIAEGPWQAEITDGNGVDSLYNEGNATYTLNGNSSVSVTIVKQSNDDGVIKAQLIKDDKVMSEQSTDAPLGTITVKMA